MAQAKAKSGRWAKRLLVAGSFPVEQLAGLSMRGGGIGQC